MAPENKLVVLAQEILEQARTSTDMSYREEALAALKNACDILAVDQGDSQSSPDATPGDDDPEHGLVIGELSARVRLRHPSTERRAATNLLAQDLTRREVYEPVAMAENLGLRSLSHSRGTKKDDVVTTHVQTLDTGELKSVTTKSAGRTTPRKGTQPVT